MHIPTLTEAIDMGYEPDDETRCPECDEPMTDESFDYSYGSIDGTHDKWVCENCGANK